MLADLRLQLVVVSFVELNRGELALGGTHQTGEMPNGRADFLDLGMRELDGVDNQVFAGFLGASFDHHDPIRRAHDHNIQRALGDFCVAGIDGEVAIHLAHAHRADDVRKWNVRDRQRARGTVDAEHVGIVFGIGREHQRDDLSFIAEAFGKERADGTINHAAGENFALAGAAFALDKAPGNASAGIGVFAVVDGEGEEIDSLTRLRIRACSGEDYVLAGAHHGRSVCLLRPTSSFKGNSFAAAKFDGDFVLHCLFLLSFKRHASVDGPFSGARGIARGGSETLVPAGNDPVSKAASEVTCGCQASE